MFVQVYDVYICTMFRGKKELDEEKLLVSRNTCKGIQTNKHSFSYSVFVLAFETLIFSLWVSIIQTVRNTLNNR